MEKETIIAAAIKYKGAVYTAKRHHLALKKAAAITREHPFINDQGFLTSNGRYVSREEAAKIAIAAGQIEALKYNPTQLFSEDLFPGPDAPVDINELFPVTDK